jgi:cell volume regulation protein A
LPFEFNFREKLFISWVGLRGSVSVFLASIPLLVGLPNAQTYFDVGFVVVLISLLVQGWTIAPAARWLGIARTRPDPFRARVELELPGQRTEELVGYPVVQGSPYLRGRIAPRWAKLALVVRDERVLTPEEAGSINEGDYVYFLTPPQKAPGLDRLFADAPPAAADATLIEDFFLPGDTSLGALAEIYGLAIPSEKASASLSECFAEHFKRPPRTGDVLRFNPVALVAHTVEDRKVTTVGLQLAEPEPVARAPWQQVGGKLGRGWRQLRVRLRRKR